MRSKVDKIVSIRRPCRTRQRAAFTAFVKPLRNAECVVYAKKPFGRPQAVLAYLARYTHQVAISNSRLTSADQTGVTFKWKDYWIEGPGRYKTMTLQYTGLMTTGSPELKAFLVATPFFGGLSDASLDLLISMLVERRFDVGATVVAEGEPGGSMFIVHSGELVVVKLGGGGTRDPHGGPHAW